MGPRAVVLGIPQPIGTNRWKDDLADDASSLGWDVTHIPARGAPIDAVVDLCRGADLLIWARTHQHDPAGDAEVMLRRVEDAGCATVGLHMDLYWGIPRRESRIGIDPFWTCQGVFTADGGREGDFADRWVNHHWCPPALGSQLVGAGVRNKRRFPGDVVFVGSVVPDIHGPHRSQLVEWARRTYPMFQHYGARRGSRQVWDKSLASLYATSTVVIGDSAEAPWYWSDRVPSTCGRGGLLAHPHTTGLAEQGFTDEHMILYDRFDFDGLGEAIKSLTVKRRTEMVRAAVDLVRSRHLWTHRLREIERIMLG